MAFPDDFLRDYKEKNMPAENRNAKGSKDDSRDFRLTAFLKTRVGRQAGNQKKADAPVSLLDDLGNG